MEINIVFRIAAVGILVAVLHQVLMRAGREEQAMLTTLAGLVVVLFWVIQYISQLFDTVRPYFSFEEAVGWKLVKSSPLVWWGRYLPFC